MKRARSAAPVAANVPCGGTAPTAENMSGVPTVMRTPSSPSPMPVAWNWSAAPVVTNVPVMGWKPNAEKVSTASTENITPDAATWPAAANVSGFSVAVKSPLTPEKRYPTMWAVSAVSVAASVPDGEEASEVRAKPMAYQLVQDVGAEYVTFEYGPVTAGPPLPMPDAYSASINSDAFFC